MRRLRYPSTFAPGVEKFGDCAFIIDAQSGISARNGEVFTLNLRVPPHYDDRHAEQRDPCAYPIQR